jgi:tetratricopeptide (TPR) repeat protein
MQIHRVFPEKSALKALCRVSAQSNVDLVSDFCYGNYKKCIQKKGASSMLRRIASAFLLVFFFSSMGMAAGIRHFDPKEIKARNLLLEAFQAVSPYQRTAKLKEVLKISPDNYFALIKLGEMELGRGNESELKAIELFLRAALAQPQRPEAYLALAQIYFEMGYVPEGTDYMMKALMGARAKLTYETVCLEGQNYLDTSNYFGAVITFADAALSRNSPWRGDPYLMRKLYEAATLSDAPSFWVWKDSGLAAEGVGNVYWIQYVFAKMVANSSTFDEAEAFKAILRMVRENAEKLREFQPKLTGRSAEKLINRYLYRRVMAQLRSEVGEPEYKRFQLPQRFFNFGMCNQETLPKLDENLDLYEVFIGASVTDPKERKALMTKLDSIKKEALKAVAGIKDPKERGKALFKWLRENLIVKYDAVDGIPAEGVINKQKYLCLSGAILYTLIGRDAGLDVNGFIIPRHAFASLHDTDGRKIIVETTAPVKETVEAPAGFDMPEEIHEKAYGYGVGSDLRGQALFVGETSPIDLVTYQYVNVGIAKLDNLMINKYRDQLETVLKEANMDLAEIERLIQVWRRGSGGRMKTAAMIKMAEKYPKFHDDMTKAIDEGLDTLSRARSFNPFNVEFLRALESLTRQFTAISKASPSSSMLKRLRKIKELRRREMEEGIVADMRRDVETEGNADDQEAKDRKEQTAKAQDGRDGSKADKKSRDKDEQPKGTVEQQDEAPEIESAERKVDRAVATARADYEATAEEISKEWPREKEFWLLSLRRLEKLAENHPCSGVLRSTLLEFGIFVTEVLKLAKEVSSELEEGQRLDYDDIIDELNRIRIEFFDENPAMAEKLSSKLRELL